MNWLKNKPCTSLGLLQFRPDSNTYANTVKVSLEDIELFPPKLKKAPLLQRGAFSISIGEAVYHIVKFTLSR
jgi:hypothetical protein